VKQARTRNISGTFPCAAAVDVVFFRNEFALLLHPLGALADAHRRRAAEGCRRQRTRPASTAPARKAPAAGLRLPRSQAWLIRLLPGEAACYGQPASGPARRPAKGDAPGRRPGSRPHPAPALPLAGDHTRGQPGSPVRSRETGSQIARSQARPAARATIRHLADLGRLHRPTPRGDARPPSTQAALAAPGLIAGDSSAAAFGLTPARAAL